MVSTDKMACLDHLVLPDARWMAVPRPIQIIKKPFLVNQVRQVYRVTMGSPVIQVNPELMVQ